MLWLLRLLCTVYLCKLSDKVLPSQEVLRLVFLSAETTHLSTVLDVDKSLKVAFAPFVGLVHLASVKEEVVSFPHELAASAVVAAIAMTAIVANFILFFICGSPC